MESKPRPGGGWPIREEPLMAQMSLRLTERQETYVTLMARHWLVTRPEAVRRMIEEHMGARHGEP